MKYKIGNIVRVISRDVYEQNKSLMSPTHSLACGKVFTIKDIVKCSLDNKERYIFDDDDIWTKGIYWKDYMIEGLVEEETDLNKWTGLKIELELSKSVIGVSNVESLRGERFMSGFVKAIIPPEGYQFVDENGNVINATKIVLEKKKKEYPKTYEECCEIVKVEKKHTLEGEIIRKNNYKINLLESFQKLLICRDAYWKLYGEEMGLNRPWEPDYDSGVNKYGIICMNRVVQKSNPTTNWERHLNKVLDFPTEEMRDAFKENFDPDIEICKELL